VDAFSGSRAGLPLTAAASAELRSPTADAVIVLATPLFTQAPAEIVELAARQRLPALYDTSSFVAIGGLVSYGADPNDLFRRAASKPADLPIEQPTKFLLLINLKTARALGPDVPDKMLALPAEVIEKADRLPIESEINVMRNRKRSRRELLMISTALAAGAMVMRPFDAFAQPSAAQGALIARAKSLELDTPYVPPPGDALQHHAFGFA